MALSHAQRKRLLAVSLPEAKEVRLQLRDYLARTGMALSDFAHRINYSRGTVFSFLNGSYSRISSNDRNVRAAIRDFIAAHPIATPAVNTGKLYQTENVRLLRRYFYEALDHRRAYYVYGAPGTQKTHVLQHLIAELNRSEIAKNGEGRRAYYVYVRQGIRSLDLMKRVAESCGAMGMGTVDRILRNLRFDLSQRKVLLVFDEAQHLSIECLETIRELLDQPPHCGLLFAGTHELAEIFTRQALELEQWRSRFHAGQALPGISEQEAADIVHSELGLGLPSRRVQKLIAKSRIMDLRHGGQHSYVSARRLFWVIRELQALSSGESTRLASTIRTL
jgi:DNA transposition AAA+ family ATPase